MTRKTGVVIALLVVMTVCGAAQAQVLFSDNFQPQIFAQYDINRGYNEECYQGIWRQSGSLGFMTWNERAETAGADPNTQPQTGGTIIWHNWGDQELELLCSGQWGDERKYIWVSPNHNFTDSSHLEIEFDMDPNAYPNIATPYNWGAVIVGTSAQGTYVQPMGGDFTTATSGGVGFSLSWDGIWTIYQDDAQVDTGTFAGHHEGWYHIKVTIDAAAYNTSSPATIKFYVDGALIHTLVKSDGLTSNYITLAGYSVSTSYQTVFFDNFTVKLPPADTTPPVTTANPTGGIFYNKQMVTLTANEPATIHYTTNGTAPSGSSPIYAGPIEITQVVTLKFFAIDTAGNYETPKTEEYNVGPVYFTDNFQPQHFAQYDINEGYDQPGYQGIIRQAGLFAPMTWNERPETAGADPLTNEYTGATIIWHNWGNQELEFLCNGHTWGSNATKYVWASPNHNFNDSGKLDIEFKMDPAAPTMIETDTSYGWGGVIFGSETQGTYIIPMTGDYDTAQGTGVGFSLSYDAPTGISVWSVYEDTMTVASGELAYPHDEWYDIKIQIDAAAFDGSPATLRFFVDGTEIFNYDKYNGFTNNYITLAGLGTYTQYQPVFFDDFSVKGTVDLTTPVTTASPVQGVYDSGQPVTLTASEPATIYYTTDGSTPTTASTEYTGPIIISQSTNLRYFAVDGSANAEAVKQSSYTIPSGAVLFLDNFDPQQFAQYDINYGYDLNGVTTGLPRQSGTFSPMMWNERYETSGDDPLGNPQTGGTMIWHNWGNQELEFLCSGQWGDERRYIWASPNHNFTENADLVVEFDVDPFIYNSITAENFASVVIGTTAQGTYAIPTGGDYGTATSPGVGLTLATDGSSKVVTWAVYDDSTQKQTGQLANSHEDFYHVKIVIDGSGFAGTPVTISYFVDGNAVYTYTRTAGLTGNYITLGGLGLSTQSYCTHFFDNFLVTGAASYVNVPTIKDAKTKANGTMVTLTDKVLYMKKTGYGYIEETDRLNGMRLEGTISASEDTLVTINGTVQTTAGGEKFIQVDSISSGASASVKTLGTNNKFLLSSHLDGLFITAWGTVMSGTVTGNSFNITDGSDTVGIKVITDGAPGVTAGSYVTVTGAAGTDSGARVIYRK